LKSQFESREIEEIVGVRFFEQAHAQLDDAQDKYLYERIRSSTSVQDVSVQDVIERVLAYLNSPVENKRMKREVENLKEYLEASNKEAKLTLNIKGIDCKDKSGETINPQQIVLEIVLAARNRDGKLLRKVTNPNPGVKIEFQAKPNDPITFSLTEPIQFSHKATMLALQEKHKEGLVLKDDKGNQVTIQFEVQGIPTKPELPEWKDEITDETATSRREKE